MNVFQLLLLSFLVIPVLEIYLLIKVGSILGAGTTVFLVVFTAVLGAVLLRHQGFSTVRRLRANLARGEIPAVEILEGAVLLVCGALLLTPGFFTDTLGFFGLIPGVRRWLITRWVDQGSNWATGHVKDADDNKQKTIEGEFWRDKDEQ